MTSQRIDYMQDPELSIDQTIIDCMTNHELQQVLGLMTYIFVNALCWKQSQDIFPDNELKQ